MSHALTAAPGAAAGKGVTERHRLAFIDACRGICAALIAAHHLCLYGPLPEAVEACTNSGSWFFAAVGQTVSFLREHGRYAVQVFLVLGGFVHYLTFPREPLSFEQSCRLFWQRYLRLAIPVVAVLLLGLCVHALTSPLEPVTTYLDPFSLPQLLAQVFFLHNLLGYDSLMPGHWYPAIDLQFGLLVIALACAVDSVQRNGWLRNTSRDGWVLALLGCLGVGSLFVWNRESAFDVTVLYFLGTYFLGVLTAAVWTKRAPWQLWVGYCLLIGWALHLDAFAAWPGEEISLAAFLESLSGVRIRLVCALATAVMLLGVGRWNRFESWLNFRPLIWLGKISYSLFLIHTVVHWLVLTWGHSLTGTAPMAAIGWMLLAYTLAFPAAAVFYECVEKPTQRLLVWLKKSSTIAKPAIAGAVRHAEA